MVILESVGFWPTWVWRRILPIRSPVEKKFQWRIFVAISSKPRGSDGPSGQQGVGHAGAADGPISPAAL